MSWFKNLRVRFQIISLVAIATVFIAIIGSTGYYFNKMVTSTLNLVYNDELLPIVKLNNCRAILRGTQSDVFIVLNMKNVEDVRKLLEERKDRTSALEKYLNQLVNDAKAPEERDVLVSVKDSWNNNQILSQQIFDLVLSGKKQEAATIITNSNFLPETNKIINDMWKLANKRLDKVAQLNEQNQREAIMSSAIIIGTASLSLLILIVIGLWIAKLISAPIQTVTGALTEVANGNLKTADVSVQSTNEIGQLAAALNKMKHEISDVVRQIGVHSEQVAASSQELTSSAEQSAHAATLIAETITKVAEGAAEQRSAAGSASNAVNAMSTEIKGITAVTNEITTMSEKTTGVTQDGKQAIDKVTEQMHLIASGTEMVQQAINQLSTSSKEIIGIVDVIGNLASQTNLLALNAAIEAARAGEQGKGFAVVAEEVRKLAEQSQEAAQKIAGLIHENELNMNKAVTAMNERKAGVSDGIEVVEITGTTFANIASSIQTMSDQVRHISDSIQQMANGSEKAVSLVQLIDQFSQNAASYTKTVSSTTEEQSTSMEEIATASEALAKMAEQLREILHKFSV
ncbi:methyl-accepting chemotaxis protein [Propionispira arboris]|uniref:Methyl-accepting chemotaxis protein n=1 Tax=Propionispira arboris TaxID=84035 RepID=A0A1H7C8X1_9FIRM|nr:methyl-accepting chemotaxis protein [Propionispira arboris]SEJ82095.1 methyl-accepting chemotaxis protein [Propionispira arboris]